MIPSLLDGVVYVAAFRLVLPERISAFALRECYLRFLRSFHLVRNLGNTDADLVAIGVVTIEELPAMQRPRVQAPRWFVPLQPPAMTLDDSGYSGHQPMQRNFKLDTSAGPVSPEAVMQLEEDIETAISIIIINNRPFHTPQLDYFAGDFRDNVALRLRRHHKAFLTEFSSAR